MSAPVTYRLVKPTAADVKSATAIIGTPASRGKAHLARTIAVMAAALCVARKGAGFAVLVTDEFRDVLGGASPAYNHLHARMGAQAFRTHTLDDGRTVWQSIKPLVLVNYGYTSRDTIVGLPNSTTVGEGDVAMLVIPAE